MIVIILILNYCSYYLDNNITDMGEAIQELEHWTADINESCANPSLKRETFIRAAQKEKEQYLRSTEVDENLESEE